MPNTQAPVKPPASRPWQAEPLSDVLLELDSSLEGLSELEAARRLAETGPNELNAKPPRTLAQMAREQLTDPMILILLVAAVLSALLQEWAEAGIIFAIVVVNAVIGIVQERKAQSSLEALRSMSAPEARVVRDGMEMVVPARDLVPGDLVQLGDGSMAPADLRLVEAAGLRMQEAALTGESVPVEKDASAVVLPGAPLGDRSNMAFATAIVTAGRGAGIVVATGMGTEVGHIAGMLEGDEELDTPIKRKLASFGKILTIVGVAAALAVLAVGLAYGRPFAPLLLLAVSLAISVIPESLPATATITMALGVQRMARHEALVRRLPAVETLGGATVICTDKTGTLTQGKPVVTDCRPAPGVTEEELLCVAASLEKPSEHPLADAITAEAQARNIPLAPVEDFLATPGRGIRGVIQGQQLLAGNRAMLEEAGVPLDGFDAVAEGLAQAGKTPLYFAGDGRMLGVVAVADTPKPTSAEAVRAFQAMGIDVVCFTGHKSLLGPQGTGGLCIAPGVDIRPFKVGGTGVQTYLPQQPPQYPTRLEAGTLNGHGIAGLSAALDYLEETGLETIRSHEQALARQFYEGVSAIPGVTVYGDFTTWDRAPVVSLNIRDYDSSQVSDVLAEQFSIATRPGAHCAPRLHRALGTMAQGAVRFSFGWFNTEEETQAAIAAVRSVAE